MDDYKVKITPQASAQMLEIFIYISGVLKESGAATRLLDELKEVHITAVIYGRRDQREVLKQMDI